MQPQVGVKGFFIDIGVSHPSYPHGFIAGIECDGATYHSSPSARDRDKIRQDVLESLGWQIYRIWSTDWFADDQREMEKLINYLENLISHAQGTPKYKEIDDVELKAIANLHPLHDEVPVSKTQTRMKNIKNL